MGTLYEVDNSGNLIVDGGTLKVDAANNRVGVATSTPQYPLDVNGQARIGTLGGVIHGTSGVLSAGNVQLTSEVTGTLPVANGGTNSATALSGSTIMVSNGTAVVQGAAGTTSTVLHGNAAGLPTYGQVALGSEVSGTLPAANGGTGQSTYAVGDLLYASASNAVSKLADVATGSALISGGVNTAPSYGKIGLATHVSGTLPIANGGTNSGTALAGSSIMVSNGSAVVQGSAGTTTTVLHGNAAGVPTYGAVALGSDVSGTLPIGSGGTGQTTASAALNALLPSQTGNTDKALVTNGTSASWQPAGVLALKPSQQAVADMTVLVQPGTFIKSTGQGAVTVAAPLTSPSFGSAGIAAGQSRIDILCISDAGTLSITQGTAATTGSQVAPVYPTDKMTIAEVTLVNAQATITNSSIKDVRPLLNMGGGGAVDFMEEFLVGTASGNYSGVSLVEFPLLNSFIKDGKNLSVYYDGVLMREGASYDYVETLANKITFNTARTAGHRVTCRWTLGAAIPTQVTNYHREDFVATAAQQDFTLASPYPAGKIQVYQGALLKKDEDYTESGGNTIHFINALSSGDKVSFVWYDSAAVTPSTLNDYRDNFTATASQTVFTATNNFVSGGSNLVVTVGGVVMTPGEEYTENPGNKTITFLTAMSGGEKVSLIYRLSTAINDASAIDGYGVSSTPIANSLLPLNGSARFPKAVLTEVAGGPKIGLIAPTVAQTIGANDMHGMRHIAVNDCILTKLVLPIAGASNGLNIVMGVYADSGGLPGALLAQTGTFTTVNGSAGDDVVLTLASPLTLTAGLKYWLAAHVSGAIDMWCGPNSTGYNDRRKYRTVAWNATMPATFGTTSQAGATVAISGW